jgi:uncharacterized protein YjbI with pentapeptide repeats
MAVASTPGSPRVFTRASAIGLTVVLVVVLGLAVLAFVMAPALYPLTSDPQADAAARAERDGARTAAITTTRASILAALAGVGAFISISINYRNSAIANETFRVAERAHLTDRYAKAIELLGDKDSIAIRLGGIYALQQYAFDTRRAEDQLTVVEVLSAFVRLNLRRAPPREPADVDGSGEPSRGATTPPAHHHVPPADVLAAISVLAQLPDRNLMRADFTGADFTGVDIRGARLSGGNLSGADLRGAILRGAFLRAAVVSYTALSGADLSRADLTGANLTGAATLTDATLTDAFLSRADLRRANLSRADLSGADLRGADLRGTNLFMVAISPGQLDVKQRAEARNVEAGSSSTQSPPST